MRTSFAGGPLLSFFRLALLGYSSLALLVVQIQAGSLLGSKARGEKSDNGLQEQLRLHVIRANDDGLAVVPQLVGAPSLYCKKDFEEQVDAIFLNAERWASKRHESGAKSGVTTVPFLVFVHGGLNKWKDTVGRMDMVKAMMEDPSGHAEDVQYPVFMAWPADPFDSYFEHLFKLRRGLRDRGFVKKTITIVSSPAVLATDVAKAAVGIPVNLAQQAINLRDRIAYRKKGCTRKWLLGDIFQLSEAKAAEVDREYQHLLRRGEVHLTKRQVMEMRGLDAVTLPVGATVGTFHQGEVSTAAWQIMARRTRNLYIPAQTFEWIQGEPGYKHIEDRVPAGSFLTRLIKRATEARAKGYDYQITLVGHSMGTLVLNNFLQSEAREIVESHSLSRIVYLAAACSVRDGAEAIVPLLRACGSDNQCSSHLRFYNLTLHPFAEVSEAMGKHLLPHGSLLYMIDSHLGSPRTAVDRTLGSDVNVMAAINQFRLDENSSFLRFGCFDFEPGTVPMVHGDFSRVPYWRTSFLEMKERGSQLAGAEARKLQSKVNLRKDWLRYEQGR